MTTQFDFTNNEWSDIASLPVLVGYAVAMVEDSGFIGSFREIRALTHTIGHEAPEGPAQAIIEAISTIDVKEKLDEYEGHEPGVLADVAVSSCTQIVKVLADKADDDAATAYKGWVLNVGQEVADTAKEHGVRVSPGELALLERVANALAL